MISGSHNTLQNKKEAERSNFSEQIQTDSKRRLMEHFEHSLPNASQTSSFMPMQHHLPPKTRCNRCCLHHNFPYATDESNHPAVMSFCNGNFCTQTCFSSYHRYNHLSSQLPPNCSCHTHHPPRSFLPPIPQSAHNLVNITCPCCHQQQQLRSEDHRRNHFQQSYLAPDSISYPPPPPQFTGPPPHFASSYQLQSSYHHAPTTRFREREHHMDGSRISSAQEYHSHIHRHISHHGNHVVCTNRSHIRDQALYTFASRPYRRHASRTSSYPYPLHHPVDYHYPSILGTNPLLTSSSFYIPQRPLVSAFDLIASELEFEQLDSEWEEGQAAEPVGLRKEQINKLPSYIVTKKTMEEFTENERCVICMCEFEMDDKLRILPCAHEFHSECVDKWLHNNPTCPICRAVIEVT